MKQEIINKNKLITILCAVALTLGVLVSAVLFSMIPVYAEESNSFVLNTFKGDYKYSYSNTNTGSNNYRECFTGYLHFTDKKFYAFVYDTETNASFGMFRLFYYDSGSGKVKVYQNSTKSTYNFPSGFKDESAFFNIYYVDQESNKKWAHSEICAFYIQSYNTDPEFSSDLMIFNSESSMLSYCQLGDKSGLITPGAPDLTDDSYTYTGFSINGKIARWTGTTERSHLKDQEVEEYTRITYGFATSEDQTLNADNFTEYDQDFAVGEKQMTIPWSEIESNKKDGEFIRQVNFIPCYRVPGAFYLGQGVKVFFNSDGTVDKIEQVMIPSDSETIGNDISLIGFRYDNSFHAEWVDVWSNAINKSAFDLDSGGQYLSLGIKAIYYDGSKADIDFYSLDRKKLTWDKAFSDFKENNGSPIKSLYFTPYTKTGVNNPWNKGNSTVVNFDENGNASSSFDTGDDGTVHLDDFKLTGVVWNKPVVKNGTITWTGTTPNSDLLFVPDSDTLVTATYPRYDADLNTSYETWSTTTIGKGSMKVNVDYLIDYYKNSELAWNGEMWLTPCYKKGGVLYMGEPVIVNCLKGTVSDIVVDKDSGKAEQVDKTDQNKSDADSILNVGNQFYSIINGLIGSLQQLPALLTAIFGFFPSSIINLLYASFAVIIICRILGR